MTVSQHAHGLVALLQGIAVGVDIDAVGQTANDEHLGAQRLQIFNEPTHEIVAIGRAVACAYDADDALLVEIGGATVEEHERCVAAFAQPLRVLRVGQGERFDAIALVVSHLSLCPGQGFVDMGEALHQSRCGIGHHVADIVAMGDDFGCRPDAIVQLPQRCQVEVADACQRHSAERFLLSVVHISFFQEARGAMIIR